MKKLLFTIAFLSIVTLAFSQDFDVTLVVKTDCGGVSSPVSGVNVTVTPLSSSTPVCTGSTDAAGSFACSIPGGGVMGPVQQWVVTVENPCDDGSDATYTISNNQGTIVEWGDTICCPGDLGLQKNFKSNNDQVLIANIYPNPAISDLFIEVNENTLSPINYFIYKLDGGIVSYGKLENNTIDVSTLFSGSYYLKLISNDKVQIEHFIKK